jgi:anti-anti-sigma factor
MTRPTTELPTLDGPTWAVETKDRSVVRTQRLTCTRMDTPNECLLRLEGTLDNDTSADIKPLFDALVAAREPRCVTLDLAALSTIDAAGIGAIVTLFKRLRTSDRRLDVIRAQGQPRAMATRLKLDPIFGPP